MKSFCASLLGIVGIASLLTLPSCGSTYSGTPGPTADVRGSVDDTFPDRSTRDVIVFVYWIRTGLDDCSQPELPEDLGNAYNVAILDPDETTFEVRNSQAGSLVVVFLLDEEGGQADRRIDPGDPIAILQDPTCVLDDVPNRYIVNAEGLLINFSTEDEPGFPAAGTAEADSLTEEHEISD